MVQTEFRQCLDESIGHCFCDRGWHGTWTDFWLIDQRSAVRLSTSMVIADINFSAASVLLFTFDWEHSPEQGERSCRACFDPRGFPPH